MTEQHQYKYGYRSKLHDDMGFGTNWYVTPDGTEIEISVVCDDPIDCKWNDKVLVGQNLTWKRLGSPVTPKG